MKALLPFLLVMTSATVFTASACHAACFDTIQLYDSDDGSQAVVDGSNNGGSIQASVSTANLAYRCSSYWKQLVLRQLEERTGDNLIDYEAPEVIHYNVCNYTTRGASRNIVQCGHALVWYEAYNVYYEVRTSQFSEPPLSFQEWNAKGPAGTMPANDRPVSREFGCAEPSVLEQVDELLSG